MPGTITIIEVAAGDTVVEGQTLVVLEAMKMEHRIAAEADGVIARVLVEVGQSVDAHALVVEFADAVDDGAIPAEGSP
jgi:propionyl-CoA carboxylase alpha chain